MNALSQSRPIEILLVEDNPAEVRLTDEALASSNFSIRLTVAKDGAEALALLQSPSPDGQSPLPDIILLDLNLPGMHGTAVLDEIKSNPALRRIPVLVLSSSAERQDVLDAYDRHANCYITKPIDFDEYQNVIDGIQDFWLVIVRPSSDRAA